MSQQQGVDQLDGQLPVGPGRIEAGDDDDVGGGSQLSCGPQKNEPDPLLVRAGVSRWRRRDGEAVAPFCKARMGHRVVSRALVIATGVTSEGLRGVLGVDVGDCEEEVFWKAFLKGLKCRGLSGMQLVISDAHEGLQKAIAKAMSGASWRRCRVHFARNLLAHVAEADGEVVTAAYRPVFGQPTAVGEQGQWDHEAASFTTTHPKVAAVMDTAREDVLAFTGYPAAHWKRIWSTNPLERLNKEIKCRTDVVGVFPPRRRAAATDGVRADRGPR